ncbi:IS4 family transposase [Anabaena azotica]|uniref:IS4 family transposase n=1 Tax=Anabaena azotica TaxID=197653 RepID=UPI0039A7284E
MEKWAAKELAQVNLGDARRNKRLIRIVEDLAAQPDSSVPLACGNIAATKAAYNFWKSPYFQASDIRAAHRTSTIERIKEHEIVLAIQDTTNIDLTSHPAIKGVGYLDHRKSSGLKVHSTLTATSDGVPLGIIEQLVWAREQENLGIAKKRRQRETQEKESQRWLDGLETTQNLIPSGIQVVTIGDSEADIFDLFNLKRRENSHLLFRGTHNRKVDHCAKYLHLAIRQIQPSGTLTVEVNRSPEHSSRKALLTIRFNSFDIQVPLHHIGRLQLKPVRLQVILAEEENPPLGTNPISWLLITSLEINSLEDAARCIQWYTYRWLIERYHYTLKSGCGIEKLQLETADRIHMALATYTIVAWRLLWLTYEARINPDLPCDVVLEKNEWQSLCATINHNPIPPEKPPSLRDAVRMIATLGGFLGRTGDGEPGVKTIWRGLRRLHDIAVTWQLLHSDSPSVVFT